ncbi:MAG: CBS domain-containing protein [Peptococcaceae bacterium]|nr:CBS domain-containing protein [Peptococcaceae bacterium]
MLLKEIMTKNVLTLSPNDSLEDAAKLLVEHRISGAPVVDAFNNVIGMLTEGDLVRQQKPLTQPLYLMFLDSAIPINLKSLNKDWEDLTAMTVAQLMTQKVVSLHEYDEVSEAAETMLNKKINRLPIINDEGQLLGIVTRQDIIRATYLESHHDDADGDE